MEFLQDTDLPQGIQVVRFAAPGAPSAGRPDSVATAPEEDTQLEIPEGTHLTLVEILPEAAHVQFSLSIGPGAHLRHIRIIPQGADTQYSAAIGADATLELSTLILGGDSQNRYTLDCYRGSHTALYGLALPTGEQRIGNHIRLYHKEPLGESNQTFKYAVGGVAKAVFDGKIIVEPNAQKIQAYQKNNNILLTPTARVESDPQLEIYADDVRCSHGATVGQLDTAALFYMRSPGHSRAGSATGCFCAPSWTKRSKASATSTGSREPVEKNPRRAFAPPLKNPAGFS